MISSEKWEPSLEWSLYGMVNISSLADFRL